MFCRVVESGSCLVNFAPHVFECVVDWEETRIFTVIDAGLMRFLVLNCL